MSEKRPPYGDEVQTPELQVHDELTRYANKELLNEQFPGDHTFTAIAVQSCVDPNPSRGYFLSVVVDGMTRTRRLGDTLEEARAQLQDWDVIENLLGID